MKLLIVTQIVDKNDPVLGFFHRWIEEFAKHAEQVTVICLREGVHSLPENVQVHSLGKERGRQPSFVYALRFLGLAWKLRRQYDSVFVHMNHEYLLVAGWLWFFLQKKTALWYTHGSVPLTLRVASLFAQRIFTASEKSLRLATRKKKVMGHGMDVSLLEVNLMDSGEAVRLVTVSRVSRVKNIHILIDALARLDTYIRPKFIIVGEPITDLDRDYLRELKEQISTLGLNNWVHFAGPKNQTEISEILSASHVFLHASNTGSLDKAPLEALALGVSVITINPEVGEDLCAVTVVELSADGFATAIRQHLDQKPWENMSLRREARDAIAERHSLQSLVFRLTQGLTS